MLSKVMDDNFDVMQLEHDDDDPERAAALGCRGWGGGGSKEMLEAELQHSMP